MTGEVIEKHQMAGVDDRERGFNRPVGVQFGDNAYRATLHYERTFVAGESSETKEAALRELIRALHERGYRQLRSQLSFRGTQYLGNQETWVEYPDPESPGTGPMGLGDLVGRIMKLFGRSG